MAGDWIKMRKDLLTSGKVVRMASALQADRFRIIGGLLSVWSLFDTQTEDGRIDGYKLSTVDELIGWPGFAKAMADVEWLVDDGASVTVPRYDDHMSASAKRRCQEATRKRDERARSSALDADDDADASAPKKRTREDKKVSKPNGLDTACLWMPEVDKKLVAEWLAVRKTKKLQLTETAVATVRAEATKAGMTLEAAIRIAVSEAWGGFKAKWVNPDGTPKKQGNGAGGDGGSDWAFSNAGIERKAKEVGFKIPPGMTHRDAKDHILAKYCETTRVAH